jgi:hypothetical protein
MIQDVLTESIVIGIITLILGKILSRILLLINKKKNCLIRKWTEPKLVSLSLFMTGVCIHLLCELFGFNRWYCDKNTMVCVRRLSLLSK